MSLDNLWLDYAADDLKSAEVLLKEGITSMVCFHSQQAVEKLLKAYLAANSKQIPRTHNLIRLRAICEELAGKQFEIKDEQISFLNDVYIDSRYPSDFGLLPSGKPTMEDAKKAFSIASDIDSQLRKIIKKIANDQ